MGNKQASESSVVTATPPDAGHRHNVSPLPSTPPSPPDDDDDVSTLELLRRLRELNLSASSSRAQADDDEYNHRRARSAHHHHHPRYHDFSSLFLSPHGGHLGLSTGEEPSPSSVYEPSSSSRARLYSGDSALLDYHQGRRRARQHHHHGSAAGTASGSGTGRRRYQTVGPVAGSLGPHFTTTPGGHLLFIRGLHAKTRCPLCSKDFLSVEMEEHYLSCMARPRVRFNEDTLTQDSGECSICLDDMCSGEKIARLPCLCIYHLKCLQKWYKVNQTCPAHPDSTAYSSYAHVNNL